MQREMVEVRTYTRGEKRRATRPETIWVIGMDNVPVQVKAVYETSSDMGGAWAGMVEDTRSPRSWTDGDWATTREGAIDNILKKYQKQLDQAKQSVAYWEGHIAALQAQR